MTECIGQANIPEVRAKPNEVTVLNSDRICTPAETLDRVASALRDYGVTRVAKITGLDRIGLPVWNAIRPNARSIVVHQGKGLTDAQAKVSACMEALERAVAECPATEGITCSKHQLAFEGLAFDGLEEFLAVGGSLPGSDPIEWMDGVDLLTNKDVLVPLEAAKIDRTKQNSYWQSSDGLASGNNQEEARLQGLLERIERDADVLFRFAKAGARANACFDPRNLKCPVVDQLLDMVLNAGFCVVALNVTSDFGIPTILAYLFPRMRDLAGLKYIDVTMGSGTHFSAANATVRAITEAMQSRLTLISGIRDDIPPELFAAPLHATVMSDLQLRPSCEVPTSVEDVGDSVQDRISKLLQILRGKGIKRILAVDLAPSERRFSVAKLLVPELESPPGNRARQFGARAMSQFTKF